MCKAAVDELVDKDLCFGFINGGKRPVIAGSPRFLGDPRHTTGRVPSVRRLAYGSVRVPLSRPGSAGVPPSGGA
jgi:hypothetical protein